MTRVTLFLLVVCPQAIQSKEPAIIGDALGGRLNGIGCGFRCEPPPSLQQEVAGATAVFIGTIANPRATPAGGDMDFVTDFNVLGCLKGPPELRAMKVILLNRRVEVKDPKQQYLVFFDIKQGVIDAYRGIELKSNELVDYLRGTIALDPRKQDDALAYYHRHITSPDKEVSEDAMKALMDIPYEVLRKHVRLLPLDKILVRFESKDVSLNQRALDAIVLGHTGIERYADLVRKQIDVHNNEADARCLDGLLIGYTLLKPKEGIALSTKMISQPESPFMIRYMAMKSLRFFSDIRRDVIPEKQIGEAIAGMLSQSDAADLAIEDMRRRKDERFLDQVLSMYGKKDFDIPIIRREVMQFALSFRDNPKAARFIQQRRAENLDWVDEIEQYLKTK